MEEEVGARLVLRDREQFIQGSKESAAAVNSIGNAAEESAVKAEKSTKRWSLFGSKVKTAGVTAVKSLGVVGAEAGTAFGEGFTRDAQGRLHDANGYFVQSGAAIGESLGVSARTTADEQVAMTGRSSALRSRLKSGFALAGEEAGTSFGHSMRERAMEYGKVLVGGFLAFFAAEKVKEVFTEGITLANEAAKAQKGTAAALKSTHDASGETGKSIHELAEHLSQVSAQSPIATQGLTNMLLTFPGIKKGNDIFKRTAELSQDVATRMGGSLSSGARMLGKAINDPINGMTALSRVGIKFTDTQTKVITSLVDTGNKAKAQAYILHQVQLRVGGAAAAAVTPTERLHLAWENFEELVGKKVQPTLNRFRNWLAGKGIDDIKKFGKAVGHELGPPLHQVIGFIKTDAIPLVKTFFGFLDKHQSTIKTMAKWFLVFYGVLKGYYLLVKVITFVTKIWAGVQALLDGTLEANPIGLIIIAIAALTTGIIYAYKNSQTFREVVATAMIIVKGAIMDVVGGAKILWHWATVVFDFMKDHWKLIVSFIFPMLAPLILVATHFGTIKKMAESAWGFIKSMPGRIKSAFVDLAKILVYPFQMAFHLIAVAWNNSVGRIGFHTPGWLGPLGHKGFSIPNIPDPGMPALAGGGPVVAGQAYIVGERGWEIFVPSASGVVLPHNAVRGGDGMSSPAISHRTHVVSRSDDRITAADLGVSDEDLVAVLELDGKVVAETVFRHTRRKAARA